MTKTTNLSGRKPTTRVGYCSIAILFISTICLYHSQVFAALAKNTESKSVSFSCENTRQINGAFNQILPIQKIKISSVKIFNEFVLANNTNDDFSYLKNNRWYISSSEKQYIDLAKLEKRINEAFPGTNISLWIDFELPNDSSQMSISPLFLASTEKDNHKLPNAKVFFYNEQSPVSKSLGLPKNNYYIEQGPIYKEYNYNFGMINRLARTVNSAYLYDAVSCIINRDLDFSNIHLIESNFNDITFNFGLWPKELTRLKQSLAQIVFDQFFKEENLKAFALEKFKDVFTGINISKLASQTTINLHHIDESRAQAMVAFLNSLPRSESRNDQLVFRFFDKAKIIGEELTTQEIDNTSRARNFNAYNPNKNLSQSLLTHVTLTKTKDNLYYFYFHSNGDLDHYVGIGPIDFKKLYWRESKISYSQCTDLAMKHLNEYERKAFLFTAKYDLEINSFKDLQKILEFQKYPLDEFIITNNCRGAGNIEFEWPGIIKGYFQLPSTLMREIINSISTTENDFDDLFTELRLTKFYHDRHTQKLSPDSLKNYALSLWSRYKETDYKWIRFNNTEKALKNCSTSEIEKNLLTDVKETRNLKFTYDMGKINYSQFLGETRMKSGHIGERDPIVYIGTPCNSKEAQRKIPFALRAPRQYISTPIKDYWNKATCEIIPYRFDTYADLLRYDIYLSKFEVDGVYTGQSLTYEKFEMSAHDLTLLKNNKERMKFDFKNAYSFKNLRMIDQGDHFSLIFESEDKKFNFIIGNINKETLRQEFTKNRFKSFSRPWAGDNFRGINSLVGINPFGLSNFYDAKVTEERPLFSYFYDEDGKILNHHNLDIGLEMWYIRQTENGLQLDILAHERITPVAKILIEDVKI